jgi:hypothetical protein
MATFDSVRSILGPLEAVEEKTIHGSPALYVRGKLLACPAIHQSAEPHTIMVNVSATRRSALLNADPRVYYITDHYARYSTILVRLDRIKHEALQELLLHSWQSAGAGSGRGRKRSLRRR